MTQHSLDGKWLISVDDHVIEPPNVWVDRLPAKHRDQGPRWVIGDDGEAWLFEDTTRVPVAAHATGGAVWPEEDRPDPYGAMPWGEVPESCYDPAARIAVMDRNRVLASVCFPNMGGFAGSLFQRAADKELALACIQAYNDWFLEEWVDAFPGRFIGLAVVPHWDGRLAAAEAERAIAKGARTVSLSMAPQNLGFPPISDDHWEPLFSLMSDARLPVCTHLGTGVPTDVAGSGRDVKTSINQLAKLGDINTLAERMAKEGGRPIRVLPGAVASLLGAQMGTDTLEDWLTSGNFARYPGLRVAMSENGVGWMPSVLSMADWRETMNRQAGAPDDGPMPSDVFRERVVGCFVHEPITPQLLDVLGADNIMVECDYPHTATNGPHTMERLEECVDTLAPDVVDKILRGTAERVFQFTPARPPALVAA